MCATVSPDLPVVSVRPMHPASPVSPVCPVAPTCQASSPWWTMQKIDWYVRASRCSDFHERLACEIAGLIPKDKSILEVGCGLGYITAELSRKGYAVFGIDNDEEAIKRARELHIGPRRPDSKELFALEDYRTSQRKANVVLAVFCGRIDEEGLGAFEKLADERVIYIVSQHKSNSLRQDRTAGICTYLEENGYRFTFKELTMHFDQPFESLEEASHFLELQHGNAAQGASQENAAPTTQVFVDSLGREVELPVDIQKVAPSGSMAQVIVYQIAPEKLCGLASNLSGMSKEIYLDSMADLPVFGTLYGKKANLNKETVIMAAPDVFIDVGDIKKGSAEAMAADLDKVQEEIGIPVIFFEANLDNYHEVFTKLGALLGYAERGEQLGKYAEEALQYATTNPVDGKTVYLAASTDGLSTYTKGSSHSQAVEKAGGNNVITSDLTQSNGTVSLETLYTINPEYILCVDPSAYDTIMNSAEWQSIDAVKNGNVYKVPNIPHGFVTGPPCTNRIVGLFWLTSVLYPERGVDIVAKTIEFYSLFYHYELTQEQAKAILYMD